MKINLFFTIAAAIVTILFLSCNDRKVHSEAHLQSVRLTDEMAAGIAELDDRLRAFSGENNALNQKLQDINMSDSSLAEMIENHQATIGEMEALLEKYLRVLKEHRNYIKAHESTDLSPLQTEAHHAAMKKNYNEFHTDSFRIISVLQNLIAERAAYLNAQ